jgi:hypothetical protein
MPELDEFASRVGVLVAYMASRRVADEAAAKAAVKLLRADPETSAALDAFCDATGIELMHNPSVSVLRVFPSDRSSAFACDAEEIRKVAKIAKGERADIPAFFILSTIAAFYPSRSALNQGHRIEVTVDDVLQMVQSMVEFAGEQPGDHTDPLSILASRLNDLSDDTGETSKVKGFKSTYAERALATFEDQGYAVKVEGGRCYMATETLRMLAVNRVNYLKGQLSQILSDFHDHIEAAVVED